MKFEGFEKKIKQFVMVVFLSSAQSVYFNQLPFSDFGPYQIIC